MSAVVTFLLPPPKLNKDCASLRTFLGTIPCLRRLALTTAAFWPISSPFTVCPRRLVPSHLKFERFSSFAMFHPKFLNIVALLLAKKAKPLQLYFLIFVLIRCNPIGFFQAGYTLRYFH